MVLDAVQSTGVVNKVSASGYGLQGQSYNLYQIKKEYIGSLLVRGPALWSSVVHIVNCGDNRNDGRNKFGRRHRIASDLIVPTAARACCLCSNPRSLSGAVDSPIFYLIKNSVAVIP